MKRHVGFLLLAVILMCNACAHTTYSGMYSIHMKPSSAIPFEDFGMQISRVLRPYGMLKQKPRPGIEQLRFVHNGQVVSDHLSNMNGVGANVVIAVWPKSLSISIRDFDHQNETEYVRVVKKVIERFLREQHEIHSFEFKRLHVLG